MSKTDATAGVSTDAPENSENPKDAFDTLMGDMLPESDEEVEEPTEAVEQEEPEEEVSEEAEDEDETEETVEERPRRTRKSPKKRIETLLAEKRELQARIAELEESNAPAAPAARTTTAPVADDGPDPEALNEDGSPVYPLGDLDRAYIRDVIRYETKREDQEKALKQQAAKAREEQTAIANQWAEKLEEAEESTPGLRENIAELEETFMDLEPAYGQHMALTIMSLDNGPQVLHYLAQNLDEAESILEMGPSKATVALGRLDARFDSALAPAPKRTTKTPPPPPSRTRGTGARVESGSSVYDKMLREFN